MSSIDKLNFDIKRSIILAEYIKCWGMPEDRKLIKIEALNENIARPVELYIFAGEDMDQVSRVATIGLSSYKFPEGKSCHSELLMVLPYDLVDDEIGAISHYISDICHHIINSLQRNLIATEVLAEENIERVPVGWPKALLFDEPHGEPSGLSNFYIGMQHVKLSWVIPIFKNESELIKTNGVDAFDKAINQAGVSLVEVRRNAAM